MAKKWMGSKPVKCDLCGGELEDVFYDARTTSGPWGILCSMCFAVHGVGIGTGMGQIYNLNTLEKLAG